MKVKAGKEIPMKKFRMFAVFLITILLAGCAGSEGQALEAGTATQTPAPAVTSTPAPRSPTPSSTSFWRIVASTATPTPPPEAQLTVQCLKVVSEIPDDTISDGVIALDNGGVFSGEAEELFNTTSAQSVFLDSLYEILLPFGVTPNGMFGAYYSRSPNEEGGISDDYLVIVDAHGKRLKSIPIEDDWSYFVEWIDNNRLSILHTTDLSRSWMSYSRKFESRLVLDPFSGERWTLHSDLMPGWEEWLVVTESLPSPPAWYGWHGVVYDPSLTLAIYPRIIDEDEGAFTYDLWDVSQQQLVTSLDEVINLKVSSEYLPKPDWSPDGAHFVVVGGVADLNSDEVNEREMFLVSRDGKVEQITHIGSFANIWPTSHSWSPDGRYVAFFSNPSEGASYDARLAVLDTTTMDLTDYCIAIHVSELLSPVWSPDGKQLLIQDEFLNFVRVTWVDLERGLAAEFADDTTVVGWMVLPEE